MAIDTAKLAQDIAEQAAKLRDLARLMDDAEGARTGCDSGLALILRDLSFALYELAARLEAAKGLPILAHEIADHATKIKDLAKLMDDAEGARTGCDSGLALILKDISFTLYELAARSEAVKDLPLLAAV